MGKNKLDFLHMNKKEGFVLFVFNDFEKWNYRKEKNVMPKEQSFQISQNKFTLIKYSKIKCFCCFIFVMVVAVEAPTINLKFL